MSFDCLKEIDWKSLLALEEYQNQAIETAIRRAESNADITALIEGDLKNLIAGQGKMESTEEERQNLYGKELFRLHPVLVLLKRLPWLIGEYRAHGISDEVLTDTLSDVKIWMNVCERKTGYIGLLEYGWLSNHFSFRLFRLGRLQFIAQKGDVPAAAYRHKVSGAVMVLCPDGAKYHPDGEGAGVNGRPTDDARRTVLKEENGVVTGTLIHPSGYATAAQVHLNLDEWELIYQPGTSVLDMHIAEGCPLNPDEVKKSLKRAPAFFEEYLGVTGIRAFTCSSWLLDNNIAQMQPDGNIAAFQRFFRLVPHADSSDWQTRQRVFGDPDVDILNAECKTSLQKAICAWYKAGRYCRHAAGIILL